MPDRDADRTCYQLIKDKEGKKLTDEEEIQVRWKSYFQELQKKMPANSWNKLSQQTD
jgi:hypothetical protein